MFPESIWKETRSIFLLLVILFFGNGVTSVSQKTSYILIKIEVYAKKAGFNRFEISVYYWSFHHFLCQLVSHIHQPSCHGDSHSRKTCQKSPLYNIYRRRPIRVKDGARDDIIDECDGILIVISLHLD